MIISYEQGLQYLKDRDLNVSAISRPEDNTVVYITIKVQKYLKKLSGAKNCFVFFQSGMHIPEEIIQQHQFCEVDNPSKEFDYYLEKKYRESEDSNKKRKFKLVDCYYMGENVKIGKNVIIEPGVLLGHDVIIGDDCYIKSGAVLRNCKLGNACQIGENAVIGNEPFNFVLKDDKYERMLAVGLSLLSDNVSVGAGSVIDRGTTTNTIIKSNVQIDVNSHIGHDVILCENVLVTSTSLIGAFSEVGKNAHIYAAKIIKRTEIGENSTVGFNSGVVKKCKANQTVFGYPATIL